MPEFAELSLHTLEERATPASHVTLETMHIDVRDGIHDAMHSSYEHAESSPVETDYFPSSPEAFDTSGLEAGAEGEVEAVHLHAHFNPHTRTLSLEAHPILEAASISLVAIGDGGIRKVGEHEYEIDEGVTAVSITSTSTAITSHAVIETGHEESEVSMVIGRSVSFHKHGHGKDEHGGSDHGEKGGHGPGSGEHAGKEHDGEDHGHAAGEDHGHKEEDHGHGAEGHGAEGDHDPLDPLTSDAHIAPGSRMTIPEGGVLPMNPENDGERVDLRTVRAVDPHPDIVLHGVQIDPPQGNEIRGVVMDETPVPPAEKPEEPASTTTWIGRVAALAAGMATIAKLRSWRRRRS